MPQIPNLFIIGAPKTGSTALAEILNLHPEIYLDPRKEPRYFDQHIIFDDPKCRWALVQLLRGFFSFSETEMMASMQLEG